MATQINHDEHWMRLALAGAEAAAALGEVPIGALILKDDQLISMGSNRREAHNCSTKHAEIVAIQRASERLGRWRMNDCVIYVTLEPCLMCAGAIYQARFSKVIFGAFDIKAGALGSLYKINEDARLNHRFKVVSSILEKESQQLLQKFFKERRP